MEVWQQGKILIKETEFIPVKIKLIVEDGFNRQDAENATMLDCIYAQEAVDFAINKMMETA